MSAWAYAGTAVWGALTLLALAGIILLTCETCWRLRRFHRAGMARVRGDR